MNSTTVLIVDDNKVNRILLLEILRELGHIGVEAVNGKEAVELLRKLPIDLVLMDIEMPVMNGVEATEYIRGTIPYPKNKVPIIAITAHDPSSFFEEYSSSGFNQLITKPYTVKKVSKLINEFIRR